MIELDYFFGESVIMRKVGILEGVTENFLLLREINNGDILICSADNIKFVHIK